MTWTGLSTAIQGPPSTVVFVSLNTGGLFAVYCAAPFLGHVQRQGR
jgi:hypothetical protein